MSIVLPPAKTAGSEEFPVASLALAPSLRRAVLSFYRFVRQADDIADAPDLPAEVRLKRLAELQERLADPRTVDPLAAALHDVGRRHGTGPAEARELLQAFVQDVRQHRYRDWDELLAYCRLSAVPVGRFLLRLHGEDTAADPPADALCTALQILNHLQDLADDRRLLGRVYLPLPWLAAAGGEERFFDGRPHPPRRAVLDAALDQVEALLDLAACLPSRLQSRRLRVQALLTLAAGHALLRRLRLVDPASGRVRLTRTDRLCRILPAALAANRSDVQVTAGIVRRSGSSFRFGIRMLKGERRRAMHAVYAFCRLADDLADGAAPAAERQRFLDGWRHELDRLRSTPATPVGRELALAVRRFDLPEGELRLLLDGLSIDAVDRLRIGTEEELAFYWRAVAGSVGILSVRIFGAPSADPFALALARALQLVNILRDVREDAAHDRVYLPRTRLERLGVAEHEAQAVIAAPGFGQVWAELAAEAAQAFGQADRLLEGHDRQVLRPALLMMWSYRPLLERMRRAGWQPHAPRPCLGMAEKARLAWLAAQVPA
ncbi:squalene/phytoene synthase family protein [Geminicoccus flavidas]|uniref:squalene/phytoene synthase family protein n=1 Tax=Geminicoccus flavidas TaxID=2506407 RepID=UPI00135B7CE5|nr:squalene/phytoene synthase family protein [Geminicoccus flavidas]